MHLTGVYDLVAVLTHKGRSADSGHYVAWVKQENGQCALNFPPLPIDIQKVDVLCAECLSFAGKWIEYDDDNPIPQREEDIVKLSGGGRLWENLAHLCKFLETSI